MQSGKNSKSEMKIWVRESIRDVKFEQKIRVILIREADLIVNNGGLRGDVSDRWKAMGYNTEDIPDMYP